jgi:hypothetical protein
MNVTLLIALNIIIFLSFYFFSVYYKVRAAYGKSKKHVFFFATILFGITLIAPYIVIIKWYRNGDMKKQSKELNMPNRRIILHILKVTYVETDSFLDHITKKMADDYNKNQYPRKIKTLSYESEVYNSYFRRMHFAQ